MKPVSVIFCFVAVLLAMPFVLAADGDQITITSQSPVNGYMVSEGDSGFALSFSFAGDNANCSFYGNWSGGWGEEEGPNENLTPGNYNFIPPLSLFTCDESYLWNVYCVEDNDTSNYDWGDNRTFNYDCPEEEPPWSGKSYSVFLSNPWEGEMYLGDRWLFEVGEEKFSLIVTNITVDSASLMLTPSSANFTIGFLGYIDIDADGNKTNDLTVKMKRLFAEYKVIFLLAEYGYEWPVANDTGNGTANVTINETINDTLQNITDQNITNNTITNGTMNITNQTINGNGMNATGDASDGNGSGQSGSPQNSPPVSEDRSKEGLPLWIILLILMVIVIIVVYFASKMLGPTTV
ncbi:MAG: hypothetical protein JW716_04305 [Candidatus Aenigmarchaeota archaeon]|nr:hypothetical protein [Candidatus Aenigmarchaeota archaeon]